MKQLKFILSIPALLLMLIAYVFLADDELTHNARVKAANENS